MLAKSVRDLEVYKVAFEVQQRIFYLTKSFPKEEMYSLTDQIRRSSRSIGANICESWAKRRYPAHFVSKLSDADGEMEETIHWIETAFACEYIAENIRAELISQCRHIGGMLNKMMNDSDSWCKNYITKKWFFN
jgi:four helix bundle protein